MNEGHEFLRSLAVVLCVAALTTILCQRLRQPVVLGYILAGIIVGPHVPVPLVADQRIIRTLSELGVILLMFSLGLEFSLRKLLRLGPTAGITALVQCSLMVWLGFVVGRAFGWTEIESLFAGAIIAISSTTIIAKVFDERGIGGRLRDIVVGVLIVEDLIAIVLMAALTTVAAGRGLSAAEVAAAGGKLAAFLVGLVVVGMYVVPRATRAVVRLNRPETTLVASVGFCFGVALLAQAFGFSVAVGAFVAGMLIAESGAQRRIERLVHPVRDMFAAVFFVSVGMMIDPGLVAAHWVAVLAFTVLVIAGKIVSVAFGAFLTGNGTRTSVEAGMSLAQIGEFSFIIAGLGLALGATRSFLYPVAVSVSAITTLTTPWLITAAGPFANWVDRKSPRALQTFASLYGSWIESARSRQATPTTKSRIRRLVGWLLVDAGILAAIVVGAATYVEDAASAVRAWTGFEPRATRILAIAGAAALAAPFCFGVVRVSRRLGTVLGEAAFPAAGANRADTAAAPRRVLVVTTQVAAMLLVLVPLAAVTQPFVHGGVAAGVFLVVMAALGWMFWRSAENFQGHVRAGAQVIAEALAAQTGRGESEKTPSLAPVQTLLAGLGEPTPVPLGPGAPGVGRSLAELNLRGATGASVLAIARPGEGVIVPGAREVLREGDVLALAGTHEAVEAATRLLCGSAQGAARAVP